MPKHFRLLADTLLVELRRRFDNAVLIPRAMEGGMTLAT